jgi:predicted transcriptional regulator
LDKAINEMQASGTPFIGVVDSDKKLVGYISQENITEMMMLGTSALHPTHPVPPGPTGPHISRTD